ARRERNLPRDGGGDPLRPRVLPREELALTILAEWPARFGLVVHAVLGAAVVAVCTHLVVWTYPLVVGRPARPRGIAWFAAAGSILYGMQLPFGLMRYPTYKVHVAPALANPDLGWALRLFELKEHWVALGFPLLLAAWVLARRGSPWVRFACALGAALCAWT